MQKFIVDGSKIVVADIERVSDKLPVGIYNLQQDEKGNFFFQIVQDKFEVPSKIYGGEEEEIVDKVIKTFNSTYNNVGWAGIGEKGSGKTVTAKLISNKVAIPVILINSHFNGGFVNFIQSIKQDVCLFIDEFEKVFPRNHDMNSITPKLLSLMDGAQHNGYKRMFLITSNDKNIDTHLIERPGRLRYLVKYGNLSVDIIKEILNDLLLNKDHLEDAVDTIIGLNLITMDIVMKIVEETNIHDEAPSKWIDIFNVEKKSYYYDIYKTVLETTDEDTEEITIVENPKENLMYKNMKYEIRDSGFYLNQVNYGTIISHIGDVLTVTQYGAKIEYRLTPTQNINNSYREFLLA